MQQFDKFAIERSPNVFVSLDGGETSSFHNTLMFTNKERVEDKLNSVWKCGHFKFTIPHNMRGRMELIGPYTDNIVKDWKIVKINITANVDVSAD